MNPDKGSHLVTERPTRPGPNENKLVSAMKTACNELLWRFANDEQTLGALNEASCDMLEILERMRQATQSKGEH